MYRVCNLEAEDLFQTTEGEVQLEREEHESKIVSRKEGTSSQVMDFSLKDINNEKI